VDAVCEGAEKEAVGITHDSAATRDSEQVMRQESSPQVVKDHAGFHLQ